MPVLSKHMDLERRKIKIIKLKLFKYSQDITWYSRKGKNWNQAMVMVKVVYQDGENTRALKGTITKEDEFFVYVDSPFGEIKIGKRFIIKIEEGNHE